MNVVIDIGSSLAKVAVFDGTECVTECRTSYNDLTEIEETLDQISMYTDDIEKALYSSVHQHSPKLIDAISARFPFLSRVDLLNPLPLSIDYETIDTLGQDRVCAACGAWALFSQTSKGICVIDMGTCITYDVVRGGVFTGGFITPGLGIRYRSMNRYTHSLPYIKDKNTDILQSFTIPISTIEAVDAGVQWGVLMEIEGMINHITNLYDDVRIVLCGKDAFYFEKQIKSKIFVHQNLVLFGLNYIANWSK